MTEYLGFEAYDGEYKVMGLAPYGRENPDVRRKLAQVIKVGASGWDYEVDPTFIHHGLHTYSDRFTDAPPVVEPTEHALDEIALLVGVDIEGMEALARWVVWGSPAFNYPHFVERTEKRTSCCMRGIGRDSLSGTESQRTGANGRNS